MAAGDELGEDEVSARLGALRDELERELAGVARIQREAVDWPAWVLTPVRDDAVGVAWMDWGDALHVEVLGGQGGRWELGRDLSDLDFLIDVVRSVVAGRVVETFGRSRSRVDVTLADGSVATETGYGPGGRLPQPLWKRRGPRRGYSPYK